MAEWDLPAFEGPSQFVPDLANIEKLSRYPIEWNQSRPLYTTSVDHGSGGFTDNSDMPNVGDITDNDPEIWLDARPGNNIETMGESADLRLYMNAIHSPLHLHDESTPTDAPQDDERSSGHCAKAPIISPLTGHLMSEDNQRVFISRNLWKIYHDSMEGALSCWLTERNCPYVLSTFDSKHVWSSDWSNRIVRRVCMLEKAASQTLPSHNRNDQEATKALNLAIAAFAAQWAQMDKQSHFCVPSLSNQPGAWTFRTEDSFDRSMQKALWHQASRALCNQANNMSFKVIFALIIFSLTQRPHDSITSRNQYGSMQEILESDAHSTFLETALRQLHTYRRTMSLFARSYKKEALGAAFKDTFDLLFWLAVMFDTLSAAMYQRPFVVKDDDSGVEKKARNGTWVNQTSHCDLDGWNGAADSYNARRETEVELWGKYFLQKESRSGDVRKSYIRWPCSYEDAASALCDAAPVKVLMFRKVGQLQDLLCKPNPVSASTTENTIDAALDVYHQWNNTYGIFIADCIDNHEDLPARVQSWYIILAGHWHLAVFALADAIDDIDRAGLSSTHHRRLRQVSGFTTKLRSQSAFTVSELGRCSRLSYKDSSFSHSNEFHFAVNKVALLTEPWTAVLVQSFGRAGEILAGKLLQDRSSDARQQLLCCIDALWILGKKSDVALQAGQVLMRSMNNGG